MLWLLMACLVPSDEIERALDPDGDDYGPEEDCAPLDATVNPSAEEVWYDGVDQDCSGASDYDQDGDGFASAVEPDERALYGTDCDDYHATVYPGALELCGDGMVNACEGSEEAARALCALHGDVSLTEANLKLIGASGAYSTGSAVAGVGDVDGDSRGDLLVGAFGHWGGGYYSGGAYVFLSSGALADARRGLSVGAADLTLLGEEEYAVAGSSVSRVGDVDGDGRADLLVGAPGDDSNGYGAGAAYLLLSSSLLNQRGDMLDLSVSDIKFIGETDGDRAGEVLSSTVSVETEDDIYLLIGSRHQDSGGDSSGAVYLVLASSALATGETLLSLGNAEVKLVGTEWYEIGWAVAGGGDVDGDGQADVLVGSAGEGAYLLLSGTVMGAAGTTIGLNEVDLWLTEGSNGLNAGFSVSIIGDVDGDGRADVAVGDSMDCTSGEYLGTAYILLSSGTLDTPPGSISLDIAEIRLFGEHKYDLAGQTVSSAGDIDKDGRADLLVGSTSEMELERPGTAYLLLSSGTLSNSGFTLSLSEADLRLQGEKGGDKASSSIAPAGDVNGDGFDDLLIGAPDNDAGGEDAGAAYLVYPRFF